MKWTAKRRAMALDAVIEHDKLDVSTGYGAVERYDNVSQVESVVHELAHAVCLGIGIDEWTSSVVEETIAALPTWADRVDQEIAALAAEVIVLRKIKCRCWRAVVSQAAGRELDSPEGVASFIRRVECVSQAPAARAQAKAVLRQLNNLCRRGERQARRRP